MDIAFEELNMEKIDFVTTNVVKCHPPQNRPSMEHEIENCLPFLEEEIKLYNPGLIITLGKDACSALLGTTLRPWEVFTVDLIQTTVKFVHARHPSYMVRQGLGDEFVEKFVEVVNEFNQRTPR